MTVRDDPELEPSAFTPLPLGAVTPRGWLREQLEIQAESLTGNIDEIWEDLADNAWLGGERDGWERGPYYADGLVPLAHLLDDDDLLAKADRWVEGFLDSQDDDGWFRPTQVWAAVDPADPWPRFVICKVLRQHYEATGDERALTAVESFAASLMENPDDWSIGDWAEMRWMDLAVTLHWLHGQTGERWLLDLVELLAGRGFAWSEHFGDFEYKRKQDEEPLMETHVVNNAMGVKAPAVRYRQSGDDAHRQAVYDGIENLDRFHGQTTGVFTGDEHFSGKNPSQGTELCAVVEYMYALEYLTATLGDPAFGDRLERVAYNALPATFTPDMWAHQYDQQANQVICTVAERDWTNGPEANIFGQTPHFGCCHANFHQGWPKFAADLWMRSPDDGLAAAAYGPCEVTTTLDSGQDVRVVEETDYPFEDEVRFEVDVESGTSVPLYLRIPEWAEQPSVTVCGERQSAKPGTYHAVERPWQSGDEVSVSLSPGLTAERRYNGSVALSRGPLVFSLPVDSERKQVGGTPPAADWEYYPTESWNYAIDVDTTEPSRSVGLEQQSPGEVPFDPDDPPVRLTVDGAPVPEWGIEDNWAGEIRHSPTRTPHELESVTLVPYGSTMLRVTEFPLLE
jgi:DUF1680 family protein